MHVAMPQPFAYPGEHAVLVDIRDYAAAVVHNGSSCSCHETGTGDIH